MARIKGHMPMLALCLSAYLGLGAAALAQTADPSAPKPSAIGASAADRADGVRDRRVSQSQAAGMGIWKWVVPPVKMNGAFDNHDPYGLAVGKLIPADCSINWTDPDTHKLYCFTSATSLVYFLYAPHSYISRAEKGWRALKGTS